MLQKEQDKWMRWRERLKDAARLPLMVLVIFICSMAAWVFGWTLFRAAVFVFNRYLNETRKVVVMWCYLQELAMPQLPNPNQPQEQGAFSQHCMPMQAAFIHATAIGAVG